MFDAALSLLEGAAFAIRGHAKDREKALRDCQQIADACLVLRAAAKVVVVWVGDTPMVKDNADFKRFLAALPDDTDAKEKA